MEQKLCGKCQQVLPIQCFGKDKQNSHGYKNNCKKCRQIYSRSVYQQNTDIIKAKNSEYQRTHPEVVARKVKKYREAHPDAAVRDRYKRRLALLNAVYVEDVDIVVLGNRDKWICQLCLTPVDKNKKGTTSLSRSIDHVLPVSLGGEHSYANTQLAHFGCNCRKRERVAAETSICS